MRRIPLAQSARTTAIHRPRPVRLVRPAARLEGLALPRVHLLPVLLALRPHRLTLLRGHALPALLVLRTHRLALFRGHIAPHGSRRWRILGLHLPGQQADTQHSTCQCSLRNPHKLFPGCVAPGDSRRRLIEVSAGAPRQLSPHASLTTNHRRTATKSKRSILLSDRQNVIRPLAFAAGKGQPTSIAWRCVHSSRQIAGACHHRDTNPH